MPTDQGFANIESFSGDIALEKVSKIKWKIDAKINIKTAKLFK